VSVKSILPRLNNAGALNTTVVQMNQPSVNQAGDYLSPAIWSSFPWLAVKEGEWPGVDFDFRFDTEPKTPATTEGNFGLFTQFAGATGAITPSATGHGWNFTSTANGDGVAIRGAATSFRLDRSLGPLWFEVELQTSLITDALSNLFVGLMDNTALTAAVPFASATTLSNNNIVGFFKAGSGVGSGAAMSTTYKATGVTAVTVGANQVTLVANTLTKLGMLFVPSVDPLAQDPNFQSLAKFNLYFYQDGVRLASSKQIPIAQGTDFPNVAYLSPTIAWLSRSATPDVLTVRSVKVAQIFSPGFIL
jgi:hypothetical protein